MSGVVRSEVEAALDRSEFVTGMWLVEGHVIDAARNHLACMSTPTELTDEELEAREYPCPTCGGTGHNQSKFCPATAWVEDWLRGEGRKLEPNEVACHSCPTCGGTGEEMVDSATVLGIPGGFVAVGLCPDSDCIDGYPREAVERAAKALRAITGGKSARPSVTWDDLDPSVKGKYLDDTVSLIRAFHNEKRGDV